MAEAPANDSQAVREAAAGAVAPDPLTANLLAKHSAGEKLSPAEYGKLGAFKAKLKSLVTGKPAPAPGGGPGPAQPAASVGPPAPVGSLAPAETADGSLAPVPADPRLVQRTTEAVLKTCDGIARRYVTREARAAGADERTVARFDSAAGLPGPAKEMMVETSPDVAALMGLSPETLPVATFLGGLGLWATNLWLAVDELRRLQGIRKAQERPKVPPKPEELAKPAPNEN
jgi:hypothetical protein